MITIYRFCRFLNRFFNLPGKQSYKFFPHSITFLLCRVPHPEARLFVYVYNITQQSGHFTSTCFTDDKKIEKNAPEKWRSTRSLTGRTSQLVCRVPIDNNKTSRIARAENTAVWRTGVPGVGRVGRVGQVGRAGWYAECHSTTIKPAGFARAKNTADWKKQYSQYSRYS